MRSAHLPKSIYPSKIKFKGTFQGKLCIKCEKTLRYVRNKRCVNCEQSYQRSPERKLARQLKRVTKFYEGRACTNCNSTLRYTSNRGCVNCQLYSGRKWNKSSEGHVIQKIRRKSPEYKIYHKKYMENYQPIYVKTPNGKTAIQKYNKSIKRKLARPVYQQKNRAKRLQAEGSYTVQEWLALKEQYGNICLRCKKHESELDHSLQQDHVIPISKGGTNWITNIQPLCKPCNGMGGKGTKSTDYRKS